MSNSLKYAQTYKILSFSARKLLISVILSIFDKFIAFQLEMSVDQTINELSGTLAQLSMLVAQINGQIGSVTSRINQTLDNFDNVRLF